jgi:hypothetical protein
MAKKKTTKKKINKAHLTADIRDGKIMYELTEIKERIERLMAFVTGDGRIKQDR